jgi:Regulator of ribonuclease activity B
LLDLMRRIALVILFMGIFSLFGASNKPDPDESVLIQLKRAGSDLSKAHGVEFFLYLPSEAAATTAASQIRNHGFHAMVKPPLETADWLCFATKRMVPELSELQRIRHDFDRLTRELGGTYDGWGTEVEK